MKNYICSAVAGFVFSVVSFAASAEMAVDHASAHILRAAAEKAASFAHHEYAYTVEYWSRENDKELTATLHFDPRREEDNGWRLVAPAYEDLTKSERKALEALENAEEDDSGHPLLYDRIHELIDIAEVSSETPAEVIYVAPVREEGLPKDTLEVFFTLNKQEAYISRIDVKSKRSFKPAPIAKVDSIAQTQLFSAPVDDGPALIASNEAVVEGSAMFKAFKSEARQVFKDIELVGVNDSADE